MAEEALKRTKETDSRKNFVDRRKLGELLVESGLLTRGKIDEALVTQKETGRRSSASDFPKNASMRVLRLSAGSSASRDLPPCWSVNPTAGFAMAKFMTWLVT